MTKKKNPWALFLALTLALVLFASAPASAQLEISSSTVDGGGGTSTGGSFEVSGTVGQFDAGNLSAGTFELESGFWTSQNPAVPVELMSFEIASGTPVGDRMPLAIARVARHPDGPGCRQDAAPQPAMLWLESAETVRVRVAKSVIPEVAHK